MQLSFHDKLYNPLQLFVNKQRSPKSEPVRFRHYDELLHYVCYFLLLSCAVSLNSLYLPDGVSFPHSSSKTDPHRSPFFLPADPAKEHVYRFQRHGLHWL